MHGVGLWKESPIVSQPNQWPEGLFDDVLEPATPTRYLFDPALMGRLLCMYLRLKARVVAQIRAQRCTRILRQKAGPNKTEACSGR